VGDNPCGASKGGCDACTPALEKTGGYGVDHSRSGQEHHNQGGEQKFITQGAPSSLGAGAH